MRTKAVNLCEVCGLRPVKVLSSPLMCHECWMECEASEWVARNRQPGLVGWLDAFVWQRYPELIAFGHGLFLGVAIGAWHGPW